MVLADRQDLGSRIDEVRFVSSPRPEEAIARGSQLEFRGSLHGPSTSFAKADRQTAHTQSRWFSPPGRSATLFS
ncbi:hypothetical protein NG796_25080 [Laspinema sp. A4]|uniref:hypothetical protein n=1 Tax=Laspinema sp. D2d TaxID=2953686 RepID=UPI0021BB60F9|nr:hypothetical protein [Laspinema sp. D2d]MCT7986551.1 hypothetical protein [Laspinema sp. D2d]